MNIYIEYRLVEGQWVAHLEHAAKSRRQAMIKARKEDGESGVIVQRKVRKG
jgi:hypothetical protein